MRSKQIPSIIGVISDTHGLLRPEAVAALNGVDHIIHAGDIGTAEILEALRRIAPVTAVRGNNDSESWARSLPENAVVSVGRQRVYVLHDISELKADPTDYAVVIAGHSHKPMIQEKSGVLYLNPGSAGPRRFKLPVSVARLEFSRGAVHAVITELQVQPAKKTGRK